jgi:hypothetical protein
MYTIERDVLVIHPRQPFLDWINRTVEQSSPVTMEELQNDCTVFLVPEQDALEETLAYVQPLKTRLFEMAEMHGRHDLAVAVYEACLGPGMQEGFLRKKYGQLKERLGSSQMAHHTGKDENQTGNHTENGER